MKWRCRLCDLPKSRVRNNTHYAGACFWRLFDHNFSRKPRELAPESVGWPCPACGWPFCLVVSGLCCLPFRPLPQCATKTAYNWDFSKIRSGKLWERTWVVTTIIRLGYNILGLLQQMFLMSIQVSVLDLRSRCHPSLPLAYHISAPVLVVAYRGTATLRSEL